MMLEGHGNRDILVKNDLCLKIKMTGCFQNSKEYDKVYVSYEVLSRFVKLWGR